MSSSASSDGKDAKVYPVKPEKPADEIQNFVEKMSMELQKITGQELTQWQMLRFLMDHIENQTVKLKLLLTFRISAHEQNVT